MESSIAVNQLPQGISKDSELIISIPTPICKDFNLFSSLKPVIGRAPKTRKEKTNTILRLRDFLTQLTTPQFLLSRKYNQNSLNSRFNQTNPNGLCGAIALQQLRLRDQQSYVQNGDDFNVAAIDFNNRQDRNEFIGFLDEILSFVSPLTSVDDCKHTIAEMKSWIINTHGQGIKHPPSFPKSLWWDSCWYNKFSSFCSFTMFHSEAYGGLKVPSNEYATAIVSSEMPSTLSVLNFEQILKIAKRPNYFQYQGGHYFLMESPSPSAEVKRLEEALLDMSSSILDLFTQNPALFEEASLTRAPQVLDLCTPDRNSEVIENQDEALPCNQPCPPNKLSESSHRGRSTLGEVSQTRPKRIIIPNSNVYGKEYSHTLNEREPRSFPPAGASRGLKKKTVKRSSINFNLVGPANSDLCRSQKDTYYSPEEIKDILDDYLTAENSTFDCPFISLNGITFDTIPPHWKSIMNFDAALVFGRHEFSTFKKLHKIGLQLKPLFDQITKEIVQYSPASTSPDPFKFDLSLKLWAIFPPLFLRIGKLKSVNSIKARIRQFKIGDWEGLINDLEFDLKNPTLHSPKKQYKGNTSIKDATSQTRYTQAAKILHEDADIAKAFQTIVSPSQYSPVSTESIEILKSLHPQRKPENHIPGSLTTDESLEDFPDICSPQLLWQHIKSSKMGKAPGVDGLRIEHLKSMAGCGTAPWINHMATIVNIALKGQLPPWLIDLITSSRLIGILKSREEGEALKLRPIGMGVVWLKLISKTALKFHHQQILAYLEPFQFGLSSSGIESISHIIRQTLREKPHYILFRGDIKNAFNSLQRNIIFKEVQANFPLLLPWVNCLYGRFSDLWTKDIDGSNFPISSEEGVKQGETLGSALFNIGIHERIIKRLNKLLNPKDGISYGFVIAFHDDINFVVDPAAFSELDLWNDFKEGLLDCGLVLNMSKSSIFKPLHCDAGVAQIECNSVLPEGIAVRTDGVEFAGTPIGTSHFCLQFWESNLIQEITEAVPLVCAWPDVQAALCLFRLCICAKFNYFLRLTDPTAEYSNALVEKLHRLVQLGLSFIINACTVSDSYTEINDSVWQQATLPPKSGGIGIADPRRNHIPAYLATFIAGSLSKFRLESALREINITGDEAFDSQKTEIPLHQIQQCSLRDNTPIQTLFSTLINTYKLEKNGLSLEKIASQEKPQSYLSSFLHKSNDAEIRATWSPEDITRLDSCCHEGGVLITALPTKSAFTISTENHFRERLRMRLGLSIQGSSPGKCLCDGNVDSCGYHLLSVCNYGNERQSTHNAVRDAVIELCRHAGLITRPEDPSLNKMVDENTKKKTDFTCDNFLPGVPITFDASITDPRQFVLMSPQPGKAAKVREREKIKKHEPDMSKSGAIFRPFVLESFGRWGPVTRVIFKELVSRVMQSSNTHSLSLSKDTVTHYWRSKITMAMHRQASLGMQQRITIRIRQLTAAKKQTSLSLSSSQKGKKSSNSPAQGCSLKKSSSYSLANTKMAARFSSLSFDSSPSQCSLFPVRSE